MAKTKQNLDVGKLNQVERDLVTDLEGLLQTLQSGGSVADKYTCHRISLDITPRAYSAEEVRATRDLFKVSQALFAQFLGVSAKTVRAWESGKRPSDMACRFMDEIRRNPEYWQTRLRESAKVKSL